MARVGGELPALRGWPPSRTPVPRAQDARHPGAVVEQAGAFHQTENHGRPPRKYRSSALYAARSGGLETEQVENPIKLTGRRGDWEKEQKISPCLPASL